MSEDAVELAFDRALLERHRPAVHHDPQDPYRAMSARSATDYPGNLLTLRDGSVLARAGAGLTLELLANYPRNQKPDRGDRLDQTPDAVAAAARFQADPAYANRVYGRIAQHGAHTWLQYWFWFYYNPKNLLGFGKHEGDWELVQIALTDDRDPALVTCSQHTGGEGRSWGDVRTKAFDDGEHLVVYTAPFSHAMYFEAGAHPYLGGIDNPDGSEPAAMAKIEPLGAWRRWPGRWGASRGVLAQLGVRRLGGESPRSPAHQGVRWNRPGDYHGGARSSAATAVSRAARLAGTLTYPRLESLSAGLSGQELVIDYALESRPLAGAGLLYVTVHDAGDPSRLVVLSTAAEIDRRAGSVGLHVPAPLVRCMVYASAFNGLRQRSDPLVATATQPA